MFQWRFYCTEIDYFSLSKAKENVANNEAENSVVLFKSSSSIYQVEIIKFSKGARIFFATIFLNLILAIGESKMSTV